MKRTYTNYSSQLKKITKTSTFDDYANFIENKILECGNMSYSHEAMQEFMELHATKILISMEYVLLGAKGLHFFLPDKNFCDWIVGCVQKLEPDHVEIITQMLGKKYVAAFHFPTEAKINSICFEIRNSEASYYLSHGIKKSENDRSGKELYGAISLTNTFFSCILDGRIRAEYTLLRDSEMWYIKLIVGLGMYLSCFPDQIKPGIPDDLKHANHYGGTKQTIGISETVMMRDGPTPHYRVGHFRILQSDRYTHKRGQAVFVQGCFVKGQAETVLAPN